MIAFIAPTVDGALWIAALGTLLTLADRIGAILYDDYFATVAGKTRCKQAHYRVNVIRGAAFARHQAHETPAQPEARRVAV